MLMMSMGAMPFGKRDRAHGRSCEGNSEGVGITGPA